MWDTDVRPLVGGRWVPFEDTLTVLGVNLTGWAFAMTVRDSRAVGAQERVTLGTVTNDTQGLRLISAAAAVQADVTAWAAQGVTIALGEYISVVRIRINEAVMEAMAAAEDQAKPGENAVMAYDIHMTPAGGQKFVAYAGDFIVRQGATQ